MPGFARFNSGSTSIGHEAGRVHDGLLRAFPHGLSQGLTGQEEPVHLQLRHGEEKDEKGKEEAHHVAEGDGP